MAGTASTTAGYSGKPLAAKLGYRGGQRALMVGVPAELEATLAFDGFGERVAVGTPEALPEGAGPFDLVHLFETAADRLETALPALRDRLAPAGMIWVSWPKKSARVPTTLDENAIRAIALDAGLVDVKVCAVSEVWSGLKLVIPVARRPGRSTGSRSRE